MLKFVVVASIVLVTACRELPQTSPRAPVNVGQTDTGQPIYRYQLTRANALGVTPIPNSAIAARSAQICPEGHRELARTGWAERRISGVIYTDVKVTIVCTG